MKGGIEKSRGVKDGFHMLDMAGGIDEIVQRASNGLKKTA